MLTCGCPNEGECLLLACRRHLTRPASTSNHHGLLNILLIQEPEKETLLVDQSTLGCQRCKAGAGRAVLNIKAGLTAHQACSLDTECYFDAMNLAVFSAAYGQTVTHEY